jgi:hypothetical protein
MVFASFYFEDEDLLSFLTIIEQYLRIPLLLPITKNKKKQFSK